MKITPTSHKLIRPLEGYRALAILAVLIFHLDKTLLPGGYLGVDLFFVISGFIITKGLISAKAKGTLSLPNFYAKRFRRLFPALLVTTLITLIASWFILEPGRFALTGKAALFSLFSLGNINFWMESGYFAADSTTKPLLHMWSLSVEEQFYLFWPFVLAVFVPRSWKYWAAGLLAISFVATIWFASTQPETAFFWFPFRVYEFMGGAILSILGLRLKNEIFATLALTAGVVLFVFACVTFDEASNIALTGAATVIACVLLLISMESRLADLVFGNALFVWIGQRSYSIYLVHWPLIVLYMTANGALSGVEMVVLGCLSIALGSLLKWLVEDPFRESRSPRSLPGRRAYPAIISVAAASVFGSATVWGYQGFPGRIDTSIDSLLVEDDRYEKFIRKDTCFISRKSKLSDMPETCFAPDPNKKNMLIIGNSLAADLRRGMDLSFPEWKISQITASGCPPFMIKSKDVNCQATRDKIYKDVLNNHSYDLIVMTGFYAGAANHIKLIDAYMSERSLDYVIIGPRPSFEVEPRQLIAAYGSLDGLDTEMQSRMKIPKEIDIQNAERHYFSSIEALCQGQKNCKWQFEGARLYKDRQHLYPSGSEYLAAKFADWYSKRP